MAQQKFEEVNRILEQIDKELEHMPVEKRKLIQPLRMMTGEVLRKWENERYEANQNYPENLIYKTDQGEMVRSKSELILANMLYQNRKYLLYKYERPLELMQGDKIQVINPDFTILNIQTGKITYWEHAGRMDDPKYANQFVYKVNSYMSNGIVPGRDLIFHV